MRGLTVLSALSAVIALALAAPEVAGRHLLIHARNDSLPGTAYSSACNHLDVTIWDYDFAAGFNMQVRCVCHATPAQLNPLLPPMQLQNPRLTPQAGAGYQQHPIRSLHHFWHVTPHLPKTSQRFT